MDLVKKKNIESDQFHSWLQINWRPCQESTDVSNFHRAGTSHWALSTVNVSLGAVWKSCDFYTMSRRWHRPKHRHSKYVCCDSAGTEHCASWHCQGFAWSSVTLQSCLLNVRYSRSGVWWGQSVPVWDWGNLVTLPQHNLSCTIQTLWTLICILFRYNLFMSNLQILCKRNKIV